MNRHINLLILAAAVLLVAACTTTNQPTVIAPDPIIVYCTDSYTIPQQQKNTDSLHYAFDKADSTELRLQGIAFWQSELLFADSLYVNNIQLPRSTNGFFAILLNGSTLLCNEHAATLPIKQQVGRMSIQWIVAAREHITFFDFDGSRTMIADSVASDTLIINNIILTDSLNKPYDIRLQMAQQTNVYDSLQNGISPIANRKISQSGDTLYYGLMFRNATHLNYYIVENTRLRLFGEGAIVARNGETMQMQCTEYERKENNCFALRDTVKYSLTYRPPAIELTDCLPRIFEAPTATSFVRLTQITDSIYLDMKYATTDNFLKMAVYDCPECLLRYEVAQAIARINKQLHKQGFSLKFFDCYRPLDVQKKMWEILPNATYLANPYTTGSMHNRGVAVDLTLVDAYGVELDMGTAFDTFSSRAFPYATSISAEAKNNRAVLFSAMLNNGFVVSRSEWWHFSWISSGRFPVENMPLPCE